jgi:hypothetical protein
MVPSAAKAAVLLRRSWHDSRGCGKSESLPQRLKAAKQSKVLTAALKRCATPKPLRVPKLLRHPKAAAPRQRCCATPRVLRHPKAAIRWSFSATCEVVPFPNRSKMT